MKWAKVLKIDPSDSIEKRLRDILWKFYSQSGDIKCIIYDIDATGKNGNELTKRINSGEEIESKLSVLVNVLEEDGQVFELELSVLAEGIFKVLITDGQHIDVLGENKSIIPFLGDYDELEADSFQ
jgi:hypothetical protein